MRTLATSLLICYACCLYGQGGKWVWMQGSDQIGQPPVFGTKGVPDPANTPGHCSYTTGNWIDRKGNLWLFGISADFYGRNTAANPTYYSDMWRYEPSTNMWTWMNGTGLKNMPPVYGSKGIADSTTRPNALDGPSTCWVDKKGDLWLYTHRFTFCLWRYQPDSNKWTWMSGRKYLGSIDNGFNPVYGIKGIPDRNNNPGVIGGARNGWVDASGNLWFCGVNWETKNQTTNLSIWRFDTDSLMWTWVSGTISDTAPPSYHFGEMGVESPANLPPVRMVSDCYTGADGEFYMTGGIHDIYQNNHLKQSYLYKDVWRFNPLNAQWTWVAGDSARIDLSDTIKLSGRYTSYCDDNGFEYPRYRFPDFGFKAVSYDYKSAHVFIFSGFDYEGDYCMLNYMNDLWVFYPATGSYRWLSGSSRPSDGGSHYGTQGVPAASNIISSRCNSTQWTDAQGNLWVYGGNVSDSVFKPDRKGVLRYDCALTRHQSRSDLWKFIPDSSCLYPADFSLRLYIPNSFSPNGDGNNDRFVVSGRDIISYQITITDRWGELLYSSGDPSEINDTTRGWDGSFHSSPMPGGVYSYHIKGEDKQGHVFDKSGNITIIR